MLYIILPVYNRISEVRKFVAQLKEQTFQDYFLVLIDDGSSDGVADFVKSALKNSEVIYGKGDWYWAGCLQQGYTWLDNRGLQAEDFVLIINDDTTFERNYLEAGISVLKSNPGSVLGSQCFSRETGNLMDRGMALDWKTSEFRMSRFDEEITFFSTRGFFVTGNNFKKLGQFHPALIPHYKSDYEYTGRARNIGLKMITHDQVKVSTGQQPAGLSVFNKKSFRKFLRDYFSIKNYGQPIYEFWFIYYACPEFKYKVKAWSIILKSFLKAAYPSLSKYMLIRFLRRVLTSLVWAIRGWRAGGLPL